MPDMQQPDAVKMADVESAPPATETQTVEQGQTFDIKKRRKGFLPSLVLVRVPDDPKQCPRSIKWLITAIVSLCAIAPPLGSTILMPVLVSIVDEFNTTRSIVNLSIAFYSLAVAIFPLWWSHLSEIYGRRMVYLISFTLLGVFNIISALSVSVNMFIVMRLLAGGASASVQSVGAGTIADIWDSRERGQAMGMFFLGPMLGPLISPIIGGALSVKWSWRSTQWFMVIFGFFTLALMVPSLPETSVVHTQHKAEGEGEGEEPQHEEKAKSTPSVVRSTVRAILGPLHIIKLLRFMPVLITVYYTSITFASLYLLNISVQTVYSSPPYSFTTLLVGLTYTPGAVGSILGSVLGGRWTDYILQRAALKNGRRDENGNMILLPQDRIGGNAWLAGIMYPLALVWWGWTAEKHVFWVVPLIANLFYGFGNMLITSVTMTMLTEFVPRRSSTGVAVTNLVRNTLACVAAIIAEPLMAAIGNGWLFTAAAIVCLLSAGTLILMKRNVEEWSSKMGSIHTVGI